MNTIANKQRFFLNIYNIRIISAWKIADMYIKIRVDIRGYGAPARL